jgi:hypothetical protein
MNILRTVTIASMAALATACSATSSKPVAPVTPAIPAVANIAGNWALAVETPNGPMSLTMSVAQDGKRINAKIKDEKGVHDYSGAVDGDNVKFGHDSKNIPGLRIEYIGTVVANAISGKLELGIFGEGTFTAKRL